MVEGAKLHLKEWLLRQIESGSFEGLCWEDEDKTMFRIPWKHAAKKDYNQMEDAALFKAWAVYKGKHSEGRDKADPTVWKTRLRCALNKSTDFQEVPERNQLDISEPYKVYRILPDPGPARSAVSSESHVSTKLHLKNEFSQVNKEADLWREHRYCDLTPTESKMRSPSPSAGVAPGGGVLDVRMEVVLLYHGQKVLQVTTASPEGCFILKGQVPLGNEKIYGPCRAEQLSFPSPDSVSLPSDMAKAMNLLLCHLERGVLLWVAPDGLFIKRFCQGRVYWSGPTAQHTDRPNKLERDKTFKLLDVPTFLGELGNCLHGKGRTPGYQIDLCFGEEYPDPNIPKNRKLIMAEVRPLFAVELLQKFNLTEGTEKLEKSTVDRRTRSGEEVREKSVNLP
ncbi:interferon regulatory factor 10 isoform X2 [Cynoglossus semilaevis]|uniref:interferon regulatory factor 10 isoform X2 n=1 Tax=Cynoglossus semilaevis TaxID=244447 RepID=UPI00049538DE|nr:interferon regulatory factor 4-like isoform X2 [Cynoglossus semilaevis]